jgi:hypothetical protein
LPYSGGTEGKVIIAAFKLAITKDDYLAFARGLF